MRCPQCFSLNTKNKITLRNLSPVTYRYKFCADCQHNFKSYEEIYYGPIPKSAIVVPRNKRSNKF